MNIELFKTNAKRNPTILYIIFTVITLSIYPWFWVFSRKKILNQLTESKITESLPVIFVITSILSVFLQGYGETQLDGESAIALSGLFQLISFVLMVVIAFQMKKVLEEFSVNNEMKISYNGFLTFLLSFMYINYKLNENIDYIAQNSIVDKEETTTSDKEITSEKTPESPEDRLQKLAEMKEKGLINEDEFNSKKEVILKEM
tara:strand:+ start:292 stop:900 length:609 start_codon:yes stop_codon:yes gene_type:complete